MRRFTRAFAVRTQYVWMKMKTPTKIRTSSLADRTHLLFLLVRERPFDFYWEREDYFGHGMFSFRVPEPGFLFIAWYGPGFFCHKKQTKSLLYNYVCARR